MKRLLIILAAPLSLSACAALPAISMLGTISEAIVVNKDKVVVPATQALIVAHNAYQGAAGVATAAINACAEIPNTGPCPALLARVDQIGALSDAAKAKLDMADRGIDIAQNAADVMNIVSTIKSLAGK